MLPVRRLMVLLVVTALAAGLVLLVGTDDGGADPAVASIERKLAAGAIDDAKAELAEVRPRIDAGTAAYLDGVLRLAQGKDAEAVDMLARAHGARPDDWRVVSALVAAADNAGRRLVARSAVDGYLATHPDDERALAAAAQHWMHPRAEDQDPGRALEYIARIDGLRSHVAKAEDPTALRPEYLAKLRAQAEGEAGRRAAALEAAREATQRNAADPEAWLLLGDALRESGKIAEAIRAYREAARLAPDDPVYVEQLVMALLIPAVTEEAELLALTERLLAARPGDPAALLLRARALVRPEKGDRNYGEALTIYRSLAQRTDLPKPLRLQVLRNLGVLLVDWKQGGQEGEYLREAHELLRRYVREGGEIDESLRSTWEALERG